jgi:hypothetical protein
MTYCSICRRKITRNRTVDNKNICSECIMNLKNHNYNVVIEKDNVNNNDEACSITNNNLESYCEEELTTDHVNCQAEPIVNYIDDFKDTKTGSIETFKDALIFTITELKNTILFLQNELEEKNLLVRTLLLRNANDKLDSELLKSWGKSDDLIETSSTNSDSENTNLEENVNNMSNISADASTKNVSETRCSSNDMYEQLYSPISNFSLCTSKDDNDSRSNMITIDNIDEGDFSSSDNNGTASINTSITELSSTLSSTLPSTLTTTVNSYSLYSDTSINTLNETDKSNATYNIDKYDRQIANYRYKNHCYYMEERRKANNVNDAKKNNSRDFNQIKEAIKEIQSSLHESNQGMHKWPKKTILIASDSMLSGLDEQRLSRYHHVKVRCFSGSTVKDMYHYLYPLLQKEPEYLILHVGTNDCTYHTSDTVLKDLLSLKKHVEVKIPGIKVILSLPVSRFDNNVTSCQRVQELIKKLVGLNLPCLNNCNLTRKHIGKKGLHLNNYGTARYAMNLISLIKSF